MLVRNAHPDHIGLETIDNNVEHTRWPCVSHPTSMPCLEAQHRLARKGIATLTQAPRVVPGVAYRPPERLE